MDLMGRSENKVKGGERRIKETTGNELERGEVEADKPKERESSWRGWPSKRGVEVRRGGGEEGNMGNLQRDLEGRGMAGRLEHGNCRTNC